MWNFPFIKLIFIKSSFIKNLCKPCSKKKLNKQWKKTALLIDFIFTSNSNKFLYSKYLFKCLKLIQNCEIISIAFWKNQCNTFFFFLCVCVCILNKIMFYSKYQVIAQLSCVLIFFSNLNDSKWVTNIKFNFIYMFLIIFVERLNAKL